MINDCFDINLSYVIPISDFIRVWPRRGYRPCHRKYLQFEMHFRVIKVWEKKI